MNQLKTCSSFNSYEIEKPISRIVIFEKCKKYDYEKNGLKYWLNRDGEVIRIDDKNRSYDVNSFIGYKGVDFLGAGYVYAPYIAAIITETNFLDYSPKIMSRYANKTINNSFYGLLTI
jgi:hypothetical protein